MPRLNSSWIDSIRYRALEDGSSYLAVFLKREDARDAPTALLYGPQVPAWLPGLLAAGTGKRSPGLAFNRLVKGKFPYQKVVGREKVRELKEMMS